jgi:hypothetical protein
MDKTKMKLFVYYNTKLSFAFFKTPFLASTLAPINFKQCYLSTQYL